jgi:cell division protein FtsQ
LLLALFVVVTLVVGFFWLRTSDVFAVRRIVAGATTHVSEDQLRAVTQPALGVSLLRLSTRPLERALEDIPYVRLAHVRRRFPDTLEVDVEEYLPQARVAASNGGQWLVAADGRVLEKVPQPDPPQTKALPLVTSEEVLEPKLGQKLESEGVVAALAVTVLIRSGAKTWSDAHPVEHVRVDRNGEVVMTLLSGVEVRLGEPTSLEQKLMVATQILDYCIRQGRSLAYVDVKVPSRAVTKDKTP